MATCQEQMHWMFQCSPTHGVLQGAGRLKANIQSKSSLICSREQSPCWSGQPLVHLLDEVVERGCSREESERSLKSTTALSTLHLPITYVRMLRLTSLLPFNIVMPRKLKSHTSVLFLTSDGESRELYIIYTGPEHRLCAQPSFLHTVHT